jgi:hypothetical protein
MPMINDADSLTWGRLVKSWATGLNYVNTPAAEQPPHPPAPLPAAWTLPQLSPVNFKVTIGASTVQKTIPGALYLSTVQFAALLGAAGINAVNFPPGTTEVIIVQGNANTMVLRLPPTSVLQTTEQSLLNGGAYPTPTFYEPLYTPPGGAVVHANPPILPDRAGIMNLHANRIGDYTMGLCA